jgi:hypothetical protein
MVVNSGARFTSKKRLDRKLQSYHGFAMTHIIPRNAIDLRDQTDSEFLYTICNGTLNFSGGSVDSLRPLCLLVKTGVAIEREWPDYSYNIVHLSNNESLIMRNWSLYYGTTTDPLVISSHVAQAWARWNKKFLYTDGLSENQLDYLTQEWEFKPVRDYVGWSYILSRAENKPKYNSPWLVNYKRVMGLS